MTPCFVVRVLFLAAEAMPRLRNTSTALSISPPASWSAFLHSIMPAPVRSRSCFTNCALISAISFRVSVRIVLKPEKAASLVSAVKPLEVISVSLGFAARNGCRFLGRSFGRRSLTGQGDRGQVFVGQALRHQLIEMLRIEVRVLGRELFRLSLIGDDLLHREVLLSGKRAPFHYRVGDL